MDAGNTPEFSFRKTAINSATLVYQILFSLCMKSHLHLLNTILLHVGDCDKRGLVLRSRATSLPARSLGGLLNGRLFATRSSIKITLVSRHMKAYRVFLGFKYFPEWENDKGLFIKRLGADSVKLLGGNHLLHSNQL